MEGDAGPEPGQSPLPSQVLAVPLVNSKLVARVMG